MASIRRELVAAACNRAYALVIHDNPNSSLDKTYELRRKMIHDDKSLTKEEKSEAIKKLNKDFDYYKLLYNEGTKRICENCKDECLATLYCEHCVRNYLKSNFSNWTSGNNDIDNLIQKCQTETISPDLVIEWIPYNNLQNIEYLTKGGCSEIYTAVWIDGGYKEWDSKEKRLKRIGEQKVVLKKLENVQSANRNWFDEGKFHLTISSKHGGVIAKCHGLTKDPSNGNYFLVIDHLDMNLREYLQQNHNKLTWKERTKIARNILSALRRIHRENAIHRDLHSGNILFSQTHQIFEISDLGFCGPADKPLNSIYGNLPYIAPEVIAGKGTTFASDVYSFGMLMWEISSGRPPFINYEYNYDLAMKIINGMRPKIMAGIPLEYKELIEQCWDADPTKRPDIDTLENKIREINKLNYQNILDENNTILETNSYETADCTSSRQFISKVYQFENLPEPRNATEEQQEKFHSNYSFNIPDSIGDLNDNALKSSNIIKDASKKLPKVFENLQISSNSNIQNDCKKENVQQMKHDIDNTDDNDNDKDNPEEQDELEIPDGKIFKNCSCSIRYLIQTWRSKLC